MIGEVNYRVGSQDAIRAVEGGKPMGSMEKLRARLVCEQLGQGTVEYSLILMLIAVVVIVALRFLAGDLSADLSYIGNNL